MEIIKPNKNYEEEYNQFIKEVKKEDEIQKIGNAYRENETFKDMLIRVSEREKGINLNKNDVKSSIMWIVDKDEIVGVIDLRHELNQSYFIHLGHVAYYIKKDKRGRRISNRSIAESRTNIQKRKS